MNVLPPLITDDTPLPEGPCYVCKNNSPLKIGRLFFCPMHDGMVRRVAKLLVKPYANYAEDRIADLEESLRILQSKYEETLKELRSASSGAVEDEWFMQKNGKRPLPIEEP